MANKQQRTHSRGMTPMQGLVPNQRRTPIPHQRYMRPQNCGLITTSLGGQLMPVAKAGLLREDGMRTSRFNVTVQMSETANMLINPVRITARAFFVPKLAFERFTDMGALDRSYNGIPEVDDNVIPWFLPWPEGDDRLARKMGLHHPQDGTLNADYLEAYNAIWNWIATETSPSLEKRDHLDMVVGPAFWANTQMRHIKPNFDDALMEGEVPLTIEGARLVVEDDSNAGSGSATQVIKTPGESNIIMAGSDGQDGGPGLHVKAEELEARMSVANIDMARQTARWARLRQQYQGLSEEWMMDQMLSGIRVRDEDLRQPFELDRAETVIGMSQRFATDSGNLEDSVTEGQASLQLTCGIPATPCGGVFMIVAQALPEMIYERQRDYYAAAMSVDDLPNRTSDELDPQPVELVTNGELDEAHSLPDDLAGYRPLNSKWITRGTAIGGKYYRPDPKAPWDEDRNRLWTPDVVDPTLGPDFYLSNDLSHDVFVDSSGTAQPFEWWTSGIAMTEGLTYFGPALRESTDDYDKVLEQINTERLKGDGTDGQVAAE